MPRLSPYLLLWLAAILPLTVTADEAQRRQHFEARIRPVLIKHCYECHSAGSKEVKGGLRVDTAQSLLRGGDAGSALMPGKPAESLLLDALRYDGVEMPPKGRLPENVIRDFEQWVRDGAWDPRTESDAPVRAEPRKVDLEQGRRHWSFQPVVSAMSPQVKDSSWPRSFIDSFVLARLEAAKLQPNLDATASQLVRRLYYDLTGLPPTPDQWQAGIQAIQSGEAGYARLVDELIDSRQFGVHWARRWLDVARYADSNGGDFNATFHNAWRYRDYVVESMNRDKPFYQFVREQIAGDLMPFDNDRQRTSQIVATGMLMVGTKMLSERDKDKLTLDVADEQLHAVGSAFLGLTLGCARCHDHKFDPIPTEDYYAMAGIFLSTRTLHGESQKYVSTWKRVDLPADPGLVAALKEYEAEKKDIEARIKSLKKQLEAAKNRITADPLFADDTAGKRTGTWKSSSLKKPHVGAGYIHDNRESKGEVSIRFEFKAPRAGEYELQMAFVGHSSHDAKVPVDVAVADAQQTFFIDQTRKTTIDGQYAAVGRIEAAQDQVVAVTVRTTGTTGYVIVDGLRLRWLDENGKPQPLPSSDGKSADGKSADGKAAERAKAVERLEQQLAAASDQLKKLTASAPEPLPKAMAVVDLEKAADCELRVRGEHRNRGPKIPRGFLQVLSDDVEFSNDSSGRLQLAEWIADPGHPLTGRVFVNRIWSQLIGEGIVRTVDNFGALGEAPTHPQLLDELAGRFVGLASHAENWNGSVKRLIREIVLSRTYRMSTDHREAAWQTDAENRLLWRANRRRLPAESLRDGMLAASGRLDLQPGGNPVPGMGVLVSNNSSDAKKYASKENTKRSLYLPMIRSELPATLTVFDLADPDLVVGKRPATNVPAQALLLMNSPFVMTCAEQLAEELLAEELLAEELDKESLPEGVTAGERGSLNALARTAYIRTLSRSPQPRELERAVQFMKSATVEKESSIKQRLTRFVHVLLATAEFRMLD